MYMNLRTIKDLTIYTRNCEHWEVYVARHRLHEVMTITDISGNQRYSCRCWSSTFVAGHNGVQIYPIFCLHPGLTVKQGDRFSSFGAELMQTSRRAGQAFGIGTGSLKPWRIAALIIAMFLFFWISSKILMWWHGSPAPSVWMSKYRSIPGYI